MQDRKTIAVAVVGNLLAVAVCLAPLAFIEPVTVKGGSMLPALAPGDLVLVARRSTVSKGDIALIREPGHSGVLHRVMSVDKRGRYHTCGDANPVRDIEPVMRSSIGGRMLGVVPFGKVMLRWRELR